MGKGDENGDRQAMRRRLEEIKRSQASGGVSQGMGCRGESRCDLLF
jgi:hypothetical protein